MTQAADQDYEAALDARTDVLFEMKRRFGQKFHAYFPDEGPLRRELYPRHMELFAAGAEYAERLFMAANRVGKTDAGAYEVTCHATGIYPFWWKGRKFTHPVDIWACGTTNETTRDIVQSKLVGPWDKPEVPGMIPSHLILGKTSKPHGLKGSIESLYVRHSSGGRSLISFKTYEQGRKSFEGTSKHVVWDDEEPPMDVYQEQLLRLLDCDGLVLVTFTPLQGMSEVVMSFLEPTEAAREVKIYIQAGWDDVPHLDERKKREVLATMLPYQIAARTKGEPSLGVGAIYPIPESDIVVPAFNVPWSWPRGYGLDVGWNRTAAPFFAEDISAGIYYVYDIHYMSVGEPSSHAMGIRARGNWLQGVIDPAARGRSQKDGTQLLATYLDLGLNLEVADNGVEAGLLNTWTLLISGRLKVFAGQGEPWLREFRKYHRDEKGKIVKENDHAMDATRYWVMSGRDKMKPRSRTKREQEREQRPNVGGTWMAG
jgi:phage terminase large subunit-like protein